MSYNSSTLPVEDYPSLIWVAVPSVLLLSAYFARRWYLGWKLKTYGIGKGAPGFQTGVRRVRVTPEIAARIRRGEEVSPEEIAAASAKAEEEERLGISPRNIIERHDIIERDDRVPSQPEARKAEPKEPVNEWLPETITAPKKRGKGKRK